MLSGVFAPKLSVFVRLWYKLGCVLLLVCYLSVGNYDGVLRNSVHVSCTLNEQ